MSYNFDIVKSITEKLLKFGLNKNEVQVYIAVLKEAECSIGAIEKTTKLHRQIIYNAANSLEAMNLLTIESNGSRRKFIAESPSRFEEISTNRLIEAQALSKELEKLRSQVGFWGEARLYIGEKEIRDYYIYSISHQPQRSFINILGVNSERYFKIFPQSCPEFQIFEDRRIKRKIKLKLLMSGDAPHELILNDKRQLLECRILKHKIIAPIDFMLWKEHVGILIYGDTPTVIDIPGEKSAEGFKKYLNLLWEQGSTLT